MSAHRGWRCLLSLYWRADTGLAGDDQTEHEAFSQPAPPVSRHHQALPGQEGMEGPNSAQLQCEVDIGHLTGLIITIII